MKKLLAVRCLLLAVRCLLLTVCCSLFAVSALNASPIPLSTTTEFTSTAIARFRAYHGETVRLTHRLTLAGAPLDLSGASARFYWRTEEMEDWWSTDATLEGNAVSCDFTPEMDPGTEAIWYFFGITQANAIAYRANGSLTLLDSPGFTPADLGEPDALAAALEALFKEADTRYATKAEHAALATQVQGKADASHTHSDLQQSATVLLQAINSEANLRETADTALEAQLAGKADASHTHTIAQVSNLQTQLNAKAATSTVSALTTRVSSLETEALRLEDAKADALTREATVNNVGSLDPMSDTSMATADQMNGLSYQKTTLGAMGFEGAAVKIKRFTTFRRGLSTDNGSTNMWLRILRHNGTAWTVAYQASVYVTHNSYNLNGMRIEHTMVHKAGTQFIPTDEPVIFCYATSESAPATSFINFGMKVVPASPNMLASGQSSLPAVNDTPGWAYSLAFDAVYEQQVALSEAFEGKADAFTVGEGLTLEAGVLKSDSAGTQQWVNETNDNYSHYLVNAREDLGDVGIRRAFAFAIRKDNASNASIIYEDGIYGGQEIPFDIVNRLYRKQDKLTAGENITIENGVISAAGGKVDVDSELSFQSTNPVQNKVVTSNLYRIDGAAVKFNASPSAGFEEFKEGSGRAFTFRDDRDHQMEMGIKEGKIAWMDGDGTKHEMTLDGGGNTEVWKGNVGFGEQDTFFGPKKVAEGEGQFYKGYPRLHNHGQDIHEVSGFSRDSRDDETVWSHRLLLPWDLAKANDTSYLMAGVVWNGQRNLFANGDTATFVQPLLPQNSGSTQSALPYAIPCFENSPVYWKGTIIWNDGTQAISKAVQIPWARVKQDVRGPDELALKRDVDAKAEFVGGSGNSFRLAASSKSLEFTIWDEMVDLAAARSDGYQGTVTLPLTSVTDALSSRISALESGGGSSPAPTLEVATWSGTVCSVPWGANPLLIDCTGQTEHDFTIQFPVADWPEGAARLLFIRATPTPTVGDGIIDSLKGGNGLLTPSVVGYDYLEQGEEHTVSAWRRGARLRLMVVDRERLSDL